MAQYKPEPLTAQDLIDILTSLDYRPFSTPYLERDCVAIQESDAFRLAMRLSANNTAVRCWMEVLQAGRVEIQINNIVIQCWPVFGWPKAAS